MNRVTLLDEEARKRGEEKYVNDRMINMNDLKTDFQCMFDLLQKYYPKEKVEAEEKIENRKISLADLRENFHKLPKDEQNKVLSSLEDMKARNQKTKREESFKKLPEDIRMAIGLPAENLKMLKVDQRTVLLKQLDDILKIETNKKQEQLIAEAIK